MLKKIQWNQFNILHRQGIVIGHTKSIQFCKQNLNNNNSLNIFDFFYFFSFSQFFFSL